MAEQKKLQPDLGFVQGVMEAGGDTVNRCYQCATCSVVCPLSTSENTFPRKEMLWAQWGLASKVSGDADVWLCHQCGDCTKYCPRGARPGDVLGAIRANAIRYYATPKALSDMLSSTGGMWGAVVAATILWFIVAAIWSQVTGEAFPFPEGHIEFHKFLSVIPIDIVVLPIVGFVAFVCYKGITAFWHDISEGAGMPKSFNGTYPTPPLGILVSNYIVPAVKEIISHERFKKCGQTAERAKGHQWVLIAFIILFAVTTIVMIYADIFGGLLGIEGFHTPLALWNPVKIAANIGAFLLIAGIWMIKSMRDQKTKEGVLKSSAQDWNLIWLIFAVGVTGLGSEVFRLINVKFLAYPVYLVHLGCVLVLFLSLPYTKFAHLLYRTTAYVHQRWAEDVKAGKAGFGLEKPVAEEEGEAH